MGSLRASEFATYAYAYVGYMDAHDNRITTLPNRPSSRSLIEYYYSPISYDFSNVKDGMDRRMTRGIPDHAMGLLSLLHLRLMQLPLGHRVLVGDYVG